MLMFPTTPPGNPGFAYSRFRLSTDAAAANRIGLARDREVEDFQFVIRPRMNRKTPDGTLATIEHGLTLSSTSLCGSFSIPVGDLEGNGNRDIAVGAPGEGDLRGGVYLLRHELNQP